MNDHTEAPTTVKEVGIHLIYIGKQIEELKQTIANMNSLFATKSSLSDVETRVTKLEARNNIKSTLLWVGLVASAIINIIALYNLFTKG